MWKRTVARFGSKSNKFYSSTLFTPHDPSGSSICAVEITRSLPWQRTATIAVIGQSTLAREISQLV
jgi:hypothetical protein